jgi:hypothetical protein
MTAMLRRRQKELDAAGLPCIDDLVIDTFGFTEVLVDPRVNDSDVIYCQHATTSTGTEKR